MDITVSNYTEISGLDPEEIEAIKQHLTISNPLFYKKVSMNLYHRDTPSELKYYETPKKGVIRIPVGCTNEIVSEILNKKFQRYIQSDDINDIRFEHNGVDYFKTLEFNGTLRKYQQDAFETCMDKTMGVVEAITASGKTVIFTAIIVARKQPTLILVNTKELAKQTIDSICKFTTAEEKDIGFIGSSKFDMKPITIGIHQSLARFDQSDFDKVNNYFSQIISDECHITAADTYYNNITQLKAKYKYGFSATPSREDGLTKVIHFASGPKIHKVPEDEVAKYITIPTYRQVKTEYDFFLPDTQEYQLMLTDLCEDEERNQLILDEMQKYKDKHCVLLCRRTSQVEYLAEKLGDDAVALTSKVRDKDRPKIMQQIKDKKKKDLVSTFGLMSTGIDVPHFEVMFFCAPIKSKNAVRQSAGRLMRIEADKNGAELVDFVDTKISLLRRQAKRRASIIKNLLQELKNE